MRTTTRFVVAGVLSLVTIGLVPATAVSTSLITPNAVGCCR